MDYSVRKIPNTLTYDWLLHKHYAHRIPSISYAFGIYDSSNILNGICTFGCPPSSSLRIGICGKEYQSIVLELNRLCLIDNHPKNLTSYFVSNCLKSLPKPSIIISYADTAHNHHGYIYQACNFIYTGLSAIRTDWHIDGLDKLHGISIADESRGQTNRVEYMRNKYKDKFSLVPRPRKHRYIYFIGTKTEINDMKTHLKYSIQPYPKGDNIKIETEYKPINQGVLI